MSFWQFLNHWWNLPYLVMLGLVGVFFVLQAVGFFTHAPDKELDAADAGGHGHDVHHDVHDVGHDVDHDVAHDVAAHGGGLHHDHHHGPQAETGVLSSLASFLGVGRVPFFVVWLTMFIFAGFSGLLINRALFVKSGSSYPLWGFPLSILASLFIGGVTTRFTAKQVARIVDVGGKGASRRRDLQGRWGVVASPRVDGEFGEVRVRDDRGHELLVHGKLAEGPALPQGAKVLLVEHDAASGMYLVEKFEPESAVKKDRA